MTSATLAQRIQEQTLDHVRQCVNRFLAECKIPYVVKPFDQDFYEACCEEAARRGCPMEDAPGIRSIRPKLVSGVGMAIYTFGLINDRPTQMYIALYTGLLMYVEDYMQHDVEIVSAFNQRYIRGDPQGHPVLDALAALLHELPQRFEPIVANIILTSALNYITAVWLAVYSSLPMRRRSRGSRGGYRDRPKPTHFLSLPLDFRYWSTYKPSQT